LWRIAPFPHEERGHEVVDRDSRFRDQPAQRGCAAEAAEAARGKYHVFMLGTFPTVRT
jgi:hypothetical protein